MTAPCDAPEKKRGTIRLFLCGDVMLGRGIDQVLQQPCDSALHEDYVTSALDYVRLAETANGPIPRCASARYVWGAALEELSFAKPDLRIVNLETSITRAEDYDPKGINYRVSPENADCLLAAQIDCCALANNHVLDWGKAGLLETVSALQRLGIASVGAGRNAIEAAAPAVLPLQDSGRVLVYSFASATSGTPNRWAATSDRAGINLLRDLSETSARRISSRISDDCRAGDIVVVSVHWGPNWGYEINSEQREFAHILLDSDRISVIHGHSSHHAKAIELYGNGLILYGCGDFLNDYEGISGYESYRGDLSLMYFVTVERATTAVLDVEIVPLQVKRFRLVRPAHVDVDWIQRTLERESRRFATRIIRRDDRHLSACLDQHFVELDPPQ